MRPLRCTLGRLRVYVGSLMTTDVSGVSARKGRYVLTTGRVGGWSIDSNKEALGGTRRTQKL